MRDIRPHAVVTDVRFTPNNTLWPTVGRVVCGTTDNIGFTDGAFFKTGGKNHRFDDRIRADTARLSRDFVRGRRHFLSNLSYSCRTVSILNVGSEARVRISPLGTSMTMAAVGITLGIAEHCLDTFLQFKIEGEFDVFAGNGLRSLNDF